MQVQPHLISDVSAFDRIEVAFDIVGVEHDKTIDEIEASTTNLGVGVLSVEAKDESGCEHAVPRRCLRKVPPLHADESR